MRHALDATLSVHGFAPGVGSLEGLLDAIVATCFAVVLFTLGIRIVQQRRVVHKPSWRELIRSAIIAVILVACFWVVVAEWSLLRIDVLLVKVVSASLALAATAWLVWSYWSMGHAFSVGTPPVSDGELVKCGPYARVRHPIYSGFVIGSIGGALAVSALFFGVVLLVIVQVVREVKAEESALDHRFGEDYARYRLRTPSRLIPGDHYVWRT